MIFMMTKVICPSTVRGSRGYIEWYDLLRIIFEHDNILKIRSPIYSFNFKIKVYYVTYEAYIMAKR